MFFELIAAIVAGFAGAGVALMANRLSGGRLPRWAMPAAAGAAMLGFAIWSEYSWFARTSEGLPAGLAVTSVNETSALWRPWTYAAPVVNRFVALDTGSIRTNDAVPDQRIARAVFFGRWSAPRVLELAVDCDDGRMAPLDSAELDEDGRIASAAWERPGPGDATLAVACA